MTPSTELRDRSSRPSFRARTRAIVEADAKYVTPSYPRPDYKLVAEKAYGVWVEDPDGNVFLDCNAGVAVCSTGHCHPDIVKAISDQAAQLIHLCGTDYYYKHMPELGRKLDEIVPIDGPTKSHLQQRCRGDRNRP